MENLGVCCTSTRPAMSVVVSIIVDSYTPFRIETANPPLIYDIIV